jgi:hypothetical protein
VKVNITLEINDHQRRGISGANGKRGMANRQEVIEEILAVWTAHCDDLDEQATINDCEGEE